MGILGWIKDKFNKGGRTVSHSYKKFSGQADSDKADELYNDVMNRFEQHKIYFENEVKNHTDKIESHVKNINEAKVYIKTELFPMFANKVKLLKDIPVTDEFIKECYNGESIKVDSIKSKDELFTIDFNKNPFKSNALAIITLGIYTRKQAKQKLCNVKEEEKRIDEEIKRMDIEIDRLLCIEQSLRHLVECYNLLIKTYKMMLNRLDNSVNFLLIKTISLAHKFVAAEMSIERLPISQRKEIQAMWSMSLIMKKMVETSILVDSSKDSVIRIKNELKKQTDMYKNTFNAA